MMVRLVVEPQSIFFQFMDLQVGSNHYLRFTLGITFLVACYFSCLWFCLFVCFVLFYVLCSLQEVLFSPTPLMMSFQAYTFWRLSFSDQSFPRQTGLFCSLSANSNPVCRLLVCFKLRITSMGWGVFLLFRVYTDKVSLLGPISSLKLQRTWSAEHRMMA